MSDERLPVSICWHCDHPLDAATGLDDSEGESPEPGAVSLCMYCGIVGIFEGEDLRLRQPTTHELDELADVAEFRRSYARFQWARQYVALNESLMRDRTDPDR